MKEEGQKLGGVIEDHYFPLKQRSVVQGYFISGCESTSE
jgi:hypothetical protein